MTRAVLLSLVGAMSQCLTRWSRPGVLGEDSQRRALLERYRAALSLPRCPLLAMGVEDLRIQFGPVVVQDRLVMVLAVVVDEHGCRRAHDFLVDDEAPHMTVGRLEDGGGWVLGCESREVVWEVAEPPREVPDCPTLAWSHAPLFSVAMSRLVRQISGSEVLAEASRRALPVRLWFDQDHDRFVLVGGPALTLYREIQALVVAHV